MRHFLPTCPSWLRFLIAVWIGACLAMGAIGGEDKAGGDEETLATEEAEDEVVKQLVFIEQHVAEPLGLVGLQFPYDVQASPDGKHLYVASQGDDALSYFTRDLMDGTLAYGGFVNASEIRLDVLDGVVSLAFSPDGAFVYAVSATSDSLVMFARDSTSGALTFVGVARDADAGIDGLDGARSVVVSPDGNNLYVAGHDDNMLSVFSRNKVTGVASFLGAYEKGDQGVEALAKPHALAMSPDGKTLYVALWKNEILVFGRDVGTGLLTYQSKLSYLIAESVGSEGTPRAIAVSPDGRFVYVTSWNNDSLSVFSRNEETGALEHLTDVRNGEPSVSSMDGPHALDISSDGRFIYVAAYSSDSVTSFRRDDETGLVTYFQSIAAEAGDEWEMNGPIAIGASPDGEHVYVGSAAGAHSLITFRREVILDPPEFVVEPVSASIEEGESVAFYALAQGAEVEYQWSKNGAELPGETLPVYSIATVSSEDDGAVFSVTASNSGGDVTSSEAVLTMLPPIAVDAPADLTALDISSTSARLAWKDAADNETGFEIQRRITGGEFTTIANVFANQTQYADETLSASTTYRYRVRAKRNDVESLWSNDAVIESFDDAPQAPANLTLLAQTYNKVTIRWSDRSAVEDGFRIMRREDEAGADWSTLATVFKNVSQYQDRSVSPESTYAYRVAAFNESGTSDFSNSVVGITGAIPVQSISPLSRSVGREASSGHSISVVSSKVWEAIPSVDWIVVTSPSNGQGTGNQGVVYRLALNEAQSERIGTVVVGGIPHTVQQEGSPPFLRVKPSRTEVGANGSTVIIDVESNMDWNVAEASDWVSITSNPAGSGYGSIVISVSPNEGFDGRVAQLQINEQIHEVEQAGQLQYLDVDTDDFEFPAGGGVGSIDVVSNEAWTANVSVDWIEVTSESTGTGDGVIAFSVLPNLALASRSAELVVNDRVVTVAQEAAIPEEPAEEEPVEEPPTEEEPGEEAPVLEAPEFVSVEVDALGATLTWIDNSSTEQGFKLRRAVVDSGKFVEVAELSANVTSYRDRDAPRGKKLEYRLAAFDLDGASKEVSITSEELPGSNIVNIMTRAGMNASGRLVYSDFPLAGDGVVVLQREGFGKDLSRTDLGFTRSATRLRMDSMVGNPFALGSTPPFDWAEYYGFDSLADLHGFDLESPGFGYAMSCEGESGAFPRGARAFGAITAASDSIVVAFEIRGEVELPVLVQAAGPSLKRSDVFETIADPVVELYSLSGAGVATLIASNDSWKLWDQEIAVAFADAVEKTGAIHLDSQGHEAALLVMLESGKYVAVARCADEASGSALLEVLDAR